MIDLKEKNMKLAEQDFRDWGVKIKNLNVHIPYFNKYMEQFKVNTPNRILAFMSNVLHESANLYYVKEIHDGSNYEGRRDLGNVQFGDGKKFLGRGFLQCSGRNNYRAFTIWCRATISGFNKDFTITPELLETPEFASLSAFWFWKVNKLEEYADKGEFVNVCSIINTGRKQNPKIPHKINGLDDRMNKLKIIEQWLKKVVNKVS